MEINRYYLDRKMERFERILTDHEKNYGINSMQFKFAVEVRDTIESIILNMLGVYEKPELHRQIAEDKAKVQGGRTRTPYEELQLMVEVFCSAKDHAHKSFEIKNEAERKWNIACSQKTAAKGAMDLAYSKLYKNL